MKRLTEAAKALTILAAVMVVVILRLAYRDFKYWKLSYGPCRSVASAVRHRWEEEDEAGKPLETNIDVLLRDAGRRLLSAGGYPPNAAGQPVDLWGHPLGLVLVQHGEAVEVFVFSVGPDHRPGTGDETGDSSLFVPAGAVPPQFPLLLLDGMPLAEYQR
jgi:hypothetical protein